ncbi:origin recognition complex subunit 3-like [Eurytemora carolleeae]|uniref:origin recognition complex subunit 3-like n=1 Tax=Eurytemora carolleeae TaxID=1294199 RepID=UPI000C779721|nr:origin recognition complex subunit 3-like [Eurytemora carolleeae]|eukprot:XP_023347360.1 origin recognition complex subunit 3-like [Eurytemora affinis]
MIFGVATTLSAVHKSLPQSTTAKLTINTFGSPNAALHLEEVVKAVVLDTEVPFKLSGRVFQFLRENFLFHDFSVNQFLAGYRFILGEHFYRNPAAALVLNEADCLKKIEDMDLDDLSFICRLNSFREYMSELELDEQAEILINPKKAKQTIKPLIQEYFDYLKTFTAVVQVLHIVSRDLPRRPLGRLLSEVYEPALAGDIHSSQQYREYIFHFLDIEIYLDVGGLPLLSEFLAKVEENLEKLRNLDSDLEYSGSPAVQSLAARFNDSSSSSPCILPSNLDNSSNTPAPSSSNTPAPSSSNTPAPGSSNSASSTRKSVQLDRYKLQATLLEAAHRNQKLQVKS